MNKAMLFGFLIMLSGCIQVVGNKQIGQIDELLTTCDSLTRLHSEADTALLSEIKPWRDSIHLKIRKIETSIAPQLAKDIERFNQLRHALPYYDAIRPLLSKELKTQTMLLTNLRSDIENGRGERGKYDEYIAFESVKTDTLRKAIYQSDSVRRQILTIFNDLHGNFAIELNAMLPEE